MKTWLALVLTLGSLSAPAFAVKTKDCPETLDVQITSLGTLNENAIFEKAQFSFAGSEREDFDRHLAEIRRDVEQLRRLARLFSFILTEKRSGVCFYADGSRADLKIYSKNGKDLVKIDLTPGSSLFTLFLNIESMSEGDLRLGRLDNRPVNSEYGEINDDGRNGDFFRTVLGFADLNVR